MYICIYIYIYNHRRHQERNHVRVILSFQQPTFQNITTHQYLSAAHVVVYFVSTEMLKCRLLK